MVFLDNRPAVPNSPEKPDQRKGNRRCVTRRSTTCLENHRELIRAPGSASEAFRRIVSYLTAQLMLQAIDLQAKIALE